MDSVLLLGATGRVGKLVANQLLQSGMHDLTLYVRSPQRVDPQLAEGARVFTGDVLDTHALSEAVAQTDWVIANLAGDLLPQARSLVRAIGNHNIKRLVWLTGLGVQHEVAGPEGEILAGYALRQPEYVEAARVIDESDTPTLLVRAPVLTDGIAKPYIIHHCGERLSNTHASRATVAQLIVDCVTGQIPLKRKESLGVVEQ